MKIHQFLYIFAGYIPKYKIIPQKFGISMYNNLVLLFSSWKALNPQYFPCKIQDSPSQLKKSANIQENSFHGHHLVQNWHCTGGQDEKFSVILNCQSNLFLETKVM